MALAQQLIDAGDLRAAEAACAEYCRLHPDRPGGFAHLARCASLAEEWTTALARWDDCIARFPPPQIGWLLGRAWALVQLGRLVEAEAGFEEAHRHEAGHPGSLVGLATVAERLEDWDRALARWDQCVATFPDQVRPAWRLGRARTLIRLDRLQDACDTLHQVLAVEPGNRSAQRRLMWLRIELGQFREALFDIERGVLKGRGEPGLLVEKARICNSLGLPIAARAAFDDALENAARVDELNGLFSVLPSTFSGWQRTRRWLAIDERLEAVLPRAGKEGPAAAALALRLRIALGDYDGFLERWRAAPAVPAAWSWRFSRLAETLEAPHFPDFAAPKIFGIGLSRTGTMSLDSALEKLGYATAHYLSAFTGDIIQNEDLYIHEALSDTPIFCQVEQLYWLFPNAKFIYTVRPYESWCASFNAHFARWHQTADLAALYERSTLRGDAPYGTDFARIHQPVYFSHPDPGSAYRAHDRRVRNFFADKPADKLLIMNVFEGDGWPALCRFLDRPVPQIPFPWEHRTRR